MSFDKLWRHLTTDEIEILTRQHNSAENWNDILVVDAFCPGKIRYCVFFGPACLGSGITLYNVHYMANYMFDDGCRVLNVNKMTAPSGTRQPFRFEIAVRNENGTHVVVASPDITIAGAYFMSQRDKNTPVHRQLARLDSTSEQYPSKLAGYVGKNALIENVNCIEDVWIGENVVLSECTKLQHVFIHSSQREPAKIGAGVIMQNAIAGKGCSIDTGTIIRNTIAGCHVSIADCARVSHCVIGDNSRIACCEMSHSLLFPFHEQHHNNSFLIASLLKGQSNIAAGATIGSNHNGRTNDCEMTAGRGFWPALCTSVKFPSHFASYTLLAKGDYPHEINSPFPFSLLNNNPKENRLEIMPAYWWMYNTYALSRNVWKYKKRDQRIEYSQHVHYQPIAPDTVEEILRVLPLLQQWLRTNTLPLKIEKSTRPVHILKASEALTAYREMLLCYILQTLHPLFSAALGSRENMETFLQKVKQTCSGEHWDNAGGQLILLSDREKLMTELQNSDETHLQAHENDTVALSSWQDLTSRLEAMHDKYDSDNQDFAFYVLHVLMTNSPITAKTVKAVFTEAARATQRACERALSEREHDRHSDFMVSLTSCTDC